MVRQVVKDFISNMSKFFRSILLTIGIFCSSSAAAETQDPNKITIATWNAEWLVHVDKAMSAPTPRSAKDLDQLKRYWQSWRRDVVAFQEVDSLSAIKDVLGDDYQYILSQRHLATNASHQFQDVNQYTGFAVKKSISYDNQNDLPLDMKPTSKLRFATYIVLRPESSSPIHLLSVHLKAGCSGKYSNKRSCRILSEQSKPIKDWIKTREAKHEHYMLVGDFNHNLSYSGDWFWKKMTSGTTAQLATKQTSASCKVRSNRNPKKLHQFRSLIDHIVTSSSLLVTDAQQLVFDSQDVLDYQLSDHCPVTATVAPKNNHRKATDIN